MFQLEILCPLPFRSWFLDIDPSSWLESHTKGRTTPLEADQMLDLTEFGSQTHDIIESLLRHPVEEIVGTGHLFVRMRSG
ncbi:hypothetical protein FHR71_005381 [Methylobacterium sp. RAS18]|nr:hypothetical protein [Methylobacterium sp. RAS18]